MDSRKTGRNVICSYCNKSFYRRLSYMKGRQRYFCNQICHGKWKKDNCKDKNNPNYRGGNQITRCHTCGKHIVKSLYCFNTYSYHFCDMKCQGRWQSKFRIGSNAAHWDDNKDDLKQIIKQSIRECKKNIEWKKQVLSRDNYTCQICLQKSGDIVVHHIICFSVLIDDIRNKIYEMLLNDNIPEHFFDINNGIVLCKKCHDDIRGKEEKYKQDFQKKAMDNGRKKIHGLY